MQASPQSKRARPGLAAELDGHWVELARFITSRRMRSSVYAGAMRDLSAAQLQALVLLGEHELRMSELAARRSRVHCDAARRSPGGGEARSSPVLTARSAVRRGGAHGERPADGRRAR